MAETTENYNISRLDSSVVNLDAPRWLAEQFLAQKSGDGQNTQDEDRMRLVINTVVAANLIEENNRPAWAKRAVNWPQKESLDKIQVNVERSQCGIRYLKLDECIIFLLPNLKTDEDTDALIEALNNLAEVERSSSDWVIDVFNLAPIPEKLIAYLIGFQKGLSSAGKKRLSLLWLRNDGLPEYMIPAVNKHFQTFKKGSFLISKI